MAVSPSVVKQNDSCQTLGQNYIILCHSSTWKRYLQIDIIAVSSNCRSCSFQSVWNIKNVCFLVCIFSTNLHRLFENHRSDLKIIIFKMRKKKKKERSHWVSFALTLFLRENLHARTSSLSLDAYAHTHTYRYMQAYLFPSWWRFQLDSRKAAYNLAQLRPKSTELNVVL